MSIHPEDKSCSFDSVRVFRPSDPTARATRARVEGVGGEVEPCEEREERGEAEDDDDGGEDGAAPQREARAHHSQPEQLH
jgi:hypothetical protein